MIEKVDYCLKLLRGKEEKYVEFRNDVKQF